jgi:hypothetical protein
LYGVYHLKINVEIYIIGVIGRREFKWDVEI